MIDNSFMFINENETSVLKEFKKNASIYEPNLFKYKKVNEDIDKKNKFETSTPILEDEKITDIQAIIRKEKVQEDDNEYKELVNLLTNELVVALKYFSVEETDISFAERKVLEIESKYSMSLIGEIFQNIYVKYNDYPNSLAGICKALGRFELKEVMPWGPTMLIGMLSHKSETVKEYAVAVVENWKSVDLLPILRNLDCSSDWLKKYIDDVIDYLGEQNGIYKKTI